MSKRMSPWENKIANANINQILVASFMATALVFATSFGLNYAFNAHGQNEDPATETVIDVLDQADTQPESSKEYEYTSD